MTLVEMCTHFATERARLVTLHLTVGAPEFYPNRMKEPHEEGVASYLGLESCASPIVR